MVLKTLVDMPEYIKDRTDVTLMEQTGALHSPSLSLEFPLYNRKLLLISACCNVHVNAPTHFFQIQLISPR